MSDQEEDLWPWEEREGQPAEAGLPEQEKRYREGLEILTRTFGSLALEDDFNRLCRRVVEEGRRILGLDRMSLWFDLADPQSVVDSFGIDEQGNLQDEETLPSRPLAGRAEGPPQPPVWKDIPLYNGIGRIVGGGWHVTVPLSTGGTLIGLIYADNLLSQRPLEQSQIELLRLYGITVGQLCQRVRAEEALQARERYLSALSEVAQALLTAEEEIPYPQILETLGLAARASRAYVFLNRRVPDGALLACQAAEWCAPGVPPRKNDPASQDFPYEAVGFGRWVEVLSQGQAINGRVADFPPAERAPLESQGVQALLALPLQLSGHWVGFIGFDNCREAREWAPSEVHFLQTTATHLSSHLERLWVRQTQESLSHLSLQLAAAASMEALAAVVREETERLLEWDAYYFAARRPGRDIFDVAEFVDTIHGQKQFFTQEAWSTAELRPPVNAVLEGHPVLINRRPGQEQPVLDRFGDLQRISASLMFAPIRREGTTIGILSAQSYTPWRYDDRDLQRLQQIADVVAPALERVHAEVARWESEERFRLLFQQSPVGVFHYDLRQRLTDCNPRLSRILRIPSPPRRGVEPACFPDPRILPALQQALEGRLGFYEGPYQGGEGSDEIWISLRTAPLRDVQGRVRGGMGIVEDLTERRKFEEQFRQAQKMQAIGTLAGGIAHDFNNLLMAILGNLELAAMSAPESLAPYLGNASRAAQRAASLVQQLLLFARERPTEPQPLDLRPLLKETVQLLRPSLDRRIEVQIQVPPDLWLIQADPSQMHQVLMNLVVNARDALLDCLEGRAQKVGQKPAVPWTLRLAVENVTVLESQAQEHLEARAGEFVRLSVSDNGAGMDPQTQQRIFEPFFTTKPVGKGTGLGLSTVYGIVQQHHGWIQVDSELGRGTTFQIYLPRHFVPREVLLAGTSPEAVPGGKETLLLVDDEDLVLHVGRDFLEHLGYTVLLARDGQEAIEVFARERHRIDLVVLDLTMPRLSGLEVMQQIRQLDPQARILLSSGYHERTPALAAQLPAGVGFVGKPYRLATLGRSVREALDRPCR